MFIYACIFREYNDMTSPSLSLHMKGISFPRFPSLYICVYIQYDISVLLYIFIRFILEKNFFFEFLSAFIKVYNNFQNKTESF